MSHCTPHYIPHNTPLCMLHSTLRCMLHRSFHCLIHSLDWLEPVVERVDARVKDLHSLGDVEVGLLEWSDLGVAPHDVDLVDELQGAGLGG